jgi:hypothetical protein
MPTKTNLPNFPNQNQKCLLVALRCCLHCPLQNSGCSPPFLAAVSGWTANVTSTSSEQPPYRCLQPLPLHTTLPARANGFVPGSPLVGSPRHWHRLLRNCCVPLWLSSRTTIIPYSAACATVNVLTADHLERLNTQWVSTTSGPAATLSGTKLFLPLSRLPPLVAPPIGCPHHRPGAGPPLSIVVPWPLPLPCIPLWPHNDPSNSHNHDTHWDHNLTHISPEH